MPIRKEAKKRRGIFAGALLTVVIATACGSNESGEGDDATSNTSTSLAPSTESTTSCEEPTPTDVDMAGVGKFTFRFDDLDGGSPTIMVYNGVCDTDASRVSSGAFNDGDVVPALCKAKGRLVPVDTAVGEQGEDSDWWIQIHGTPGEVQYAPDTYGDVEPSLEALKQCKS
jgi:hypothetical protein